MIPLAPRTIDELIRSHPKPPTCVACRERPAVAGQFVCEVCRRNIDLWDDDGDDNAA